MTDLAFDGLVNARDVGGVPVVGGGRVRTRVLYRSETPQLMTAVDTERAVGELGVRRVVDLRGPRFGSSGPLGDDGRAVSIDFFTLAGQPSDDVGRSREGFLPGLLDRAGPVVGLVLEEIVATDGATLVHCHTGKDRTGFVIGITLALLGVADDDIVADYDRSSPVFAQMLTNLQAAGLGVPDDAPAYARHAPSADGMLALLDRLRSEWESAEEYLVGSGVDRRVLSAARSHLIEPAPASAPTSA